MKNKPTLLGSEVKKLQDLPHFTIPVDVSDNCEFAGLGKEIHVFHCAPPKESTSDDSHNFFFSTLRGSSTRRT